ncbi:hypothetical protein [Streptomyces sp. NPDC127033]|uniref:hypothetical protein n=1 Tax=Streptomyces sp. NPDC127033 TaxID=3347110 RepID=UPI0036638865
MADRVTGVAPGAAERCTGADAPVGLPLPGAAGLVPVPASGAVSRCAPVGAAEPPERVRVDRWTTGGAAAGDPETGAPSSGRRGGVGATGGTAEEGEGEEEGEGDGEEDGGEAGASGAGGTAPLVGAPSAVVRLGPRATLRCTGAGAAEEAGAADGVDRPVPPRTGACAVELVELVEPDAAGAAGAAGGVGAAGRFGDAEGVALFGAGGRDPGPGGTAGADPPFGPLPESPPGLLPLRAPDGFVPGATARCTGVTGAGDADAGGEAGTGAAEGAAEEEEEGVGDAAGRAAGGGVAEEAGAA